MTIHKTRQSPMHRPIHSKGHCECWWEGLYYGVAPKTRVVTRRGKKNIRVKQDGKREFITALEAVSADGFPFPYYPIGKGSTHVLYWYKNVEAEDKNGTLGSITIKKWGIVPFNPRPVLGQLLLPTAASRAAARNHTCTDGSPLKTRLIQSVSCDNKQIEL